MAPRWWGCKFVHTEFPSGIITFHMDGESDLYLQLEDLPSVVLCSARSMLIRAFWTLQLLCQKNKEKQHDSS